MKCVIFADPEVPERLLHNLKQKIESSFAEICLEVHNCINRLKPSPVAFDQSRNQYKADVVLHNVISEMHKTHPKGSICLYLLAADAYSGSLNFVFGVGKHEGALVCLYRLNNDVDFILKECIHELGHTFGLSHCQLPCVMTFSNSVHEAYQKNTNFCASCMKKLQNIR